jgi:DNA-directed RNA polymerase subunit M/transcription elongation factor TFIIS
MKKINKNTLHTLVSPTTDNHPLPTTVEGAVSSQADTPVTEGRETVIFYKSTVKCSQCGFNACWYLWIVPFSPDFSEEFVYCDHCGHTSVLAKGSQAYENYLQKSGQPSGNGCDKTLELTEQDGTVSEYNDALSIELGSSIATAESLINQMPSQSDEHSPNTTKAESSADGITEFSKWLDSLPPLDPQ